MNMIARSNSEAAVVLHNLWTVCSMSAEAGYTTGLSVKQRLGDQPV